MEFLWPFSFSLCATCCHRWGFCFCSLLHSSKQGWATRRRACRNWFVPFFAHFVIFFRHFFAHLSSILYFVLPPPSLILMEWVSEKARVGQPVCGVWIWQHQCIYKTQGVLRSRNGWRQLRRVICVDGQGQGRQGKGQGQERSKSQGRKEGRGLGGNLPRVRIQSPSW